MTKSRSRELRKLSLIDPAAAQLIDFRNKRRTIRAFEVIFHTGRKFSEQRNKGKVDFEYKIIGLNRDRKELFIRIDKRIEEMFENGFINEVEGLLSKGYSIQDPPMSAIGYQEVIQYIQGSMDIKESYNRIKQRSHEFVRRQANWFKKSDERITWFDVTVDQKAEMISFIESEDGWINDQE
jgi:tRNA dimethylallyltransferase